MLVILVVQHKAESDPLQLHATIHPEWPHSWEWTASELREFSAWYNHCCGQAALSCSASKLKLHGTLNHLKVKCPAQGHLNTTCWWRGDWESICHILHPHPTWMMGVLSVTGLFSQTNIRIHVSGHNLASTEPKNIWIQLATSSPCCYKWTTPQLYPCVLMDFLMWALRRRKRTTTRGPVLSILSDSTELHFSVSPCIITWYIF